VKSKTILLAAAISGLCLSSGCSLAPKAETIGECHGANRCGGKGDCGGKANGCRGLNACKSKGWLKMSFEKCKKKGGAFVKS